MSIYLNCKLDRTVEDQSPSATQNYNTKTLCSHKFLRYNKTSRENICLTDNMLMLIIIHRANEIIPLQTKKSLSWTRNLTNCKIQNITGDV